MMCDIKADCLKAPTHCICQLPYREYLRDVIVDGEQGIIVKTRVINDERVHYVVFNANIPDRVVKASDIMPRGD